MENWSGILTIDNIERVAELLRQLLKGKRYTSVEAHGPDFRPIVRTGQKLKPSIPGDPIIIHHHNGQGQWWADLNIHDSYGVWMLSTHLQKDEYDKEFENPHFSFDEAKVTITHRADSGCKIFWVFAVQRDK